MMKKIVFFILLLVCSFSLSNAQEKKRVQNRPYIDMRTIHYGILFGMHMMDMEMNNVGPQFLEDGTIANIVTDVDNWNPGFTVGVLGELRLNNYFSLRVSPSMHFGQRHLRFLNLTEFDEEGRNLTQQQTIKTTYVTIPIDIKFSSQRYNNVRPYLLAGITPMMNITGKKQDILEINRSDFSLNIGMGCDFYLPFFKLIPELRFCYGLTNCINTQHAQDLTDVNLHKYTNSVNKGRSKMFILTFYFE